MTIPLQEQFYSSEEFLQYNMFNNFFFKKELSEKLLSEFLDSTPSEKILLLVDPPFGGLVNVLAKTIQSFWKMGMYGYDVLMKLFEES